MRLLEAIIDANHRALAGDNQAGLHPGDFEAELPLVALTCIDTRLNALLPQVLGVPAEQFIWLRNAGNIITGPTSSTTRSLALACAVKGGKQIAIIGHTDCQVGRTTVLELLERFRALGVERQSLPDNLVEYFGMFGSERQNVIKAASLARSSPLLGPKVPVHGLMVDLATGKVEWVVNGYDALGTTAPRWNEVVESAGQTLDALRSLTDFQIGGLQFPETKIGEMVTGAQNWLAEQVRAMEIKSPPKAPPIPAPAPTPPPLPPPPKIPLPPSLRERFQLRTRSK